jgi:TRAP-type mannitol/chloroaromatic compound transport system permease small subunit
MLISNMKRIFCCLEWLSDQLGWIAGGLTIVMMIGVMREVVGRYFFNSPSDWSLELNGYLLVALVYLSAAHTENRDSHIRIDFIYDRFEGRLKALVDTIILAIAFCWSAVVMWQGAILSLKSLQIGARSSQAMQWPLFPSQLLVPLGSGLLCLALLGKLLKNFSPSVHKKE